MTFLTRREDLPRRWEALALPAQAAVATLDGIASARAEPHRWARRSAAALLVVTLAGVALSVLVSVYAADVAAAKDDLRLCWLDGLLLILPLGVAGAALIDRRPDLPFGWLLGGAAVSQVASLALVKPATLAIVDGHNTSGVLQWAVALGSGLWFVPEGIKGIVNLRFPSGRLAGRWSGPLQWAIVAGTVLTVIGSAFGGSSLRADPADAQVTDLGSLDHPLTGGSVVGDVADGLLVCGPITVLLGLVAGIGVIVRWRRARGIERQQLTWRVVGIVIAILLFPVAVLSSVGVFARLDVLFFVLTLALPVLRYRLWSIDTLVRRSVAYAGVIALLLAAYAALAGMLAAVVSARVGAVVAAMVIAVAFAPLRIGDAAGRRLVLRRPQRSVPRAQRARQAPGDGQPGGRRADHRGSGVTVAADPLCGHRRS